MIDTSKVTDRRELRFDSVKEFLRDAEFLLQAERRGRLHRAGNWSLGQALGHLASWVNYAYEGYPVTPPWFIRMVCRLAKRRFLRTPLPRGFRMPGAEAGTYGIEEMSSEEGFALARQAFERLQNSPPTAPNPLLGRLTPDEWLELHLKHAALHLGFFRAQ